MADNFLQFLGGIGSTPPKVYGTSAEDVALRNQMASGANYWNNTRQSQTGYLPSLTGSSATNTGGAVYPWNSPAQMTPPTYGGTGATRSVQTTTRGGLDPATDKRLEYFVASDGRSVADLLQGIGNYRDPQKPAPTRLATTQQPMQPPLPPTSGLGYASTPQNPAVTAAEQAVMPPPPRPRPPYAPNTWNRMDVAQRPVGANPGMGGAMIGNGQMASSIPPQLPPADGSSPLPVWAGDNPQQAGGQPLGINVRGGQQPNVSPSERYSLANMLGQINAQKKQSNATGTAGGYQYKNGQKTGYAPINVGRGSYTPSNGAAAYALSNLAGQQAAQQRQATATGQTGTTIYKNGQKVGNVGGGTSAQAYEKAAAKSRDKGTSGEGGNPSWW